MKRLGLYFELWVSPDTYRYFVLGAGALRFRLVAGGALRHAVVAAAGMVLVMLTRLRAANVAFVSLRFLAALLTCLHRFEIKYSSRLSI